MMPIQRTRDAENRVRNKSKNGPLIKNDYSSLTEKYFCQGLFSLTGEIRGGI